MRMIGHLADEAGARTFGDYLYVQGVENRIEDEPGHGWAIWIVDEDKIAQATEMLTQFRTAPGDPKYRTEAKGATRLRAQEEKSQVEWEKRLRQRRHLFRPLHDYGFGVVTYALIVISVGVFLLCRFGMENERVSFLYMTAIQYFDGYITYAKGLPEIRHGEVWRLFTPMLVHMHFLHILFNMLWLRDLGSMVEARQSPWMLAASSVRRYAATLSAGWNTVHAGLPRPSPA